MSPQPKRPVEVTSAFLRKNPLPPAQSVDGKEGRGTVLVIGGCTEMPGAVQLAATAALRAGAGKLQVMTAKSIAAHVASAVPEALVRGLPETRGGALSPTGAKAAAEKAGDADSVLVGPGLVGGKSLETWLTAFLRRTSQPVLILDAEALVAARKCEKAIASYRSGIVLTPNAGELASLLDEKRSKIESAPNSFAVAAAVRFKAVVALKGPETFIATANGQTVYANRGGTSGLGTSGSGDTLAGIVAGLAARGAEPTLAAIWGVWLHASAGERLSRRMGELGFLAREILGEIPGLMQLKRRK